MESQPSRPQLIVIAFIAVAMFGLFDFDCSCKARPYTRMNAGFRCAPFNNQ